MPPKERWPVLLRLGWAIVVPLLANCAGHVGVSFGEVKISRVLTCSEVGPSGEPLGITSTFPATTKRVHLFMQLEGPVSAPLEIRWFRENKLVAVQQVRIPPGVSHTWLGREGGEAIPAGQYRVEIVTGEVRMAATAFEIQPGGP